MPSLNSSMLKYNLLIGGGVAGLVGGAVDNGGGVFISILSKYWLFMNEIEDNHKDVNIIKFVGI